ncbi:protease [Paenibacillus doosanensis]|uniref:Membrane protein YuaF n=1 Tax=Paenibacillus konkukensis TaxID=2020716 RepID=A0ABY4RH75_9BACL|nr:MULTISPECIES: protease [Paenibacillus]MCS7461998.1 protease [Paenibacillus doosanensis]UQZ81510.1 putative membrane protein YuaF [Paenibacillus konkukensis]
MLQLYWGFLITGVLFALVTVIFGDLLGNVLDGLFDFMSGEHLHALQPTVLFSGLTVCGGAGILLTKYTAWGTAGILGASVVCAVLISALVYFLYVKPMENSENSVAFSIHDMVGKLGEVSVTIPAVGYGEVMLRAGAGITNQIAASFEGEEIQTGVKVVTVEVKDNTLLVARFDKSE